MPPIKLKYMKYSKEQLIEMVKPYFLDNKVELLYVTEDNQVFYPNGKVDAFSHCRVYRLRPPFEIERKDIIAPSEISKESEQEYKPNSLENDDKEVLISIAREKGLKVDKRMSIATIEDLINNTEDAGE